MKVGRAWRFEGGRFGCSVSSYLHGPPYDVTLVGFSSGSSSQFGTEFFLVLLSTVWVLDYTLLVLGILSRKLLEVSIWLIVPRNVQEQHPKWPQVVPSRSNKAVVFPTVAPPAKQHSGEALKAVLGVACSDWRSRIRYYIWYIQVESIKYRYTCTYIFYHSIQ